MSNLANWPLRIGMLSPVQIVWIAHFGSAKIHLCLDRNEHLDKSSPYVKGITAKWLDRCNVRQPERLLRKLLIALWRYIQNGLV